MKTKLSILVAALAFTTGLGVASAVPASFTFTGRLLDDGDPVDGAVTIDLELYTAISGGSPIWSETHEATADDGLVSVALGGQAPLDVANFDGGDLWLAVTVNGTPLEPRFQLRSVPYAMRAEVCNDAEAVGGIPADEVQQVLDDSCAVGSAIRDIAPDGTVTCEPVGGGGGGVPAGAIAFFAAACPTGWSDYVALRGRVAVGADTGIGNPVGTQLASGGTRAITEVPTHAHPVDPPVTNSTDAGGHTPTMSSSGSHSHSVSLYTGYNGGTLGAQVASTVNGIGSGTTATDGAHAHAMGAVANHLHAVNIDSFPSGSAGVASVDVTMPYLQLRACQKN